MPVRIWALLVAIEHYQDYLRPGDGHLLGCEKDVDGMRAYLETSLHVSKDNILTLKNDEATHESILEAFQVHFINNREIGEDDAILFHFAGHGTRKPAPESWPAAWKDAADRDHQVDLIVPYDAINPIVDRRAPGIPSYTLGALLRKFAVKHKNTNATVVLDCCHSGMGVRGPDSGFRSRFVDPDWIATLQEDTDKKIWEDDSNGRALPGTTFINSQNTSHILMAACTRQQRAYGSIDGGEFTNAWLRAFTDPTFHPRSYAEHFKHIQATFRGRAPYLPGPQTPQCEGTNRDRIVFENRTADLSELTVLPMSIPGNNGTEVRIELGEIFGVKPGTVFEITGRPADPTRLRFATAFRVFPEYCIASLEGSLDMPTDGLCISFDNLATPLKFAIQNGAPGSLLGRENVDRLRKCLQAGTSETFFPFTVIASPAEADMVLSVDATGVAVKRPKLKNAVPRVGADDIEAVFPRALGHIASFNFYLSRLSPTRPFVHKVQLRLHKLEPLPAAQIGPQFMKPGKEVPFFGDEATIDEPLDASGKKPMYALVLVNNTDQPLWPYVFWFNPTDYSVSCFYRPRNSAISPLPAHSEVQLGRSIEWWRAMRFSSLDGKPDTGFLKVFFATHDVRINFVEQKPVLGRDSDGRLHLTQGDQDAVRAPAGSLRMCTGRTREPATPPPRAFSTGSEMSRSSPRALEFDDGRASQDHLELPAPALVMDQWDTLVRKITVRRKKPSAFSRIMPGLKGLSCVG